ncbi:GNAT family N-acetyltransferase [Riemerella columbina]|uniref:GNAT family N-acetyltransferase n=1 Tax=Riemerella columbina TaxID=103810 RepID=UPI00036EE964|nr:GNAT family N-acetyltransferase [Riemerella columbina]
MIQIKQEENDRRGRFVIYDTEQESGEMSYIWAESGKFIIDHTFVNPAFKGKGYGKKLLEEAVEFARKKGVKILPLCPFAKAEFDKNPSFKDILF